MGSADNQKFDFSVDELTSKEQRDIYQYWLDIRKNKLMPARKDFDPMKIPRVLPFIVMADVLDDPLRFKVRLIGSKCNTPPNFMGKCINDYPEMKRLTDFLIVGTEMRKPYFYYNSYKNKGEFIRHYSSIVLPFSNDDKDVNIMMACISLVDR
ncbi:MAG: PAS domain-containing protein [Emcibacteraceae bacterium]|nr:PAS domain-containing protein [Emcibacteraceae bacterium]